MELESLIFYVHEGHKIETVQILPSFQICVRWGIYIYKKNSWRD